VQVDEVLFRKHLLINFSTGAQEDQGRYPLARLSWVLSCSDEEGRARFGGRIVLVGNPTEDRHKTLVGDMPGTEVLANAVSSILERKPLRAVPARWALLLMFLLSALAVILIRETPGLVAAGGVLALAAGQVALSLYLIERDWWLLTASPLVAMGTASLGILAWQNDRFQDAVARLAPRRIAALAERAGGFQVEEASVLFSDIRGYTTISETMDPAEVLTYLNRYMSSVDDVLKHHGGHFVSCPGDCVVAWFGGERHGPPHEERAIRCGLEILANVDRFREEWQRETGLNFAVGVGINSGPMAVGMLQARRRMEATIIGDAVNTAARIESLTKEYGSFLVSEETLAPVRERFQAELVGDVPIKGRTQPVRLYRILALGADQKPSRSHRSLRSLQHLFLRPGSNDGGATSEGERL
jgi:adenylate cyclase